MEAPLRLDKTVAALESEIAAITETLSGPLDNATRIGLCADREQLRRELAGQRKEGQQ